MQVDFASVQASRFGNQFLSLRRNLIGRPDMQITFGVVPDRSDGLKGGVGQVRSLIFNLQHILGLGQYARRITHIAVDSVGLEGTQLTTHHLEHCLSTNRVSRILPLKRNAFSRLKSPPGVIRDHRNTLG